MKKQDLKVGYIIKTRNGDLSLVMPSKDGPIAIDCGNGWLNLKYYDDDLKDVTGGWDGTYTDYDVMEIYGYSRMKSDTLVISTNDRELLWGREENYKIKEMTMGELEEIVGYKFRIVEGTKNG